VIHAKKIVENEFRTDDQFRSQVELNDQ